MRKSQVSHFYLIITVVLSLLSTGSIASQNLDKDDETKTKSSTPSLPASSTASVAPKIIDDLLKDKIPAMDLLSFADDTDIVKLVLNKPQAYQIHLISYQPAAADISQIESSIVKRGDSFYGPTMSIDLHFWNGEVRYYHLSPPRYGWSCG